MREIKFRAWDNVNRSMASPDETRGYLSWFINTSNSIIMQYTGLKDNNGVEIYEGDIVAVEGYNHEIVFEDGGFIAVGHGNGLNSQIGDIAHIAKILGNVYENPELDKS